MGKRRRSKSSENFWKKLIKIGTLAILGGMNNHVDIDINVFIF